MDIDGPKLSKRRIGEVSLDICRVFFAGQAPVLFQMPKPIDEATPTEAHIYTGFELVFSDEFEVEGKTFWPGEFCFILLTHAPPCFSNRRLGFFLMACCALYSILIVLSWFPRHGSFNMSRAFCVISILASSDAFFFLLVSYDMMWFHSCMGTFHGQWGL